MGIAPSAATAAIVIFPAVMVYAGLMDLMTMKIRNALVVGLAAAFFILAPLAGFSLYQIGMNTGVAALVFCVTFFFFAMGWIGGGDAKLAAVTALWFAPAEAMTYFAYASFLGGLLTLVILRFRGTILSPRLAAVSWIAMLHDEKAGVPYGAAMAPAALLVFPQTAWFSLAG